MTRRAAAAVAVGLAAVASGIRPMGLQGALVSQPWLVPVAVVLVSLAAHHALASTARRGWRAVGIGVVSLAAAAAVVAGGAINLTSVPPVESPGLWHVARLLGLALGIWAAATCLLDWVHGHHVTADESGGFSWRWWAGATALLCLLWGLMLARLFPGVFTYDSFASIDQVTGAAPWSNHHPIAFTLLIGACVRLAEALGGDLRAGLGLFSAVQALLVATMLGWVVGWVAGRGWRRWGPIAVLTIFALDPVLAVYSVTAWKDILFSSYVLLLTVVLFDVVQSRGARLRQWRWVVAIGVLSFAIMLGRGNGVFVLLATLVALVVAYGLRSWRGVVAIVAAVAAGMFITGPVLSHFDVAKSSPAESLAIPLQQFGHTARYSPQRLTPEQVAFLEKGAPLQRWADLYTPGIADNIKFADGFDIVALTADKGEFASNYASIAAANPGPFAAAWLCETLGYWHIGTTNWVIPAQIHPETRRELVETVNLMTGVTGPDSAKAELKVVRDIVESPFWAAYFSIATSVWLAVAWGLLHGHRNWRALLVLAPLAGVWGSIMIAAPVWAEFRYMFAFHLAIGFLLVTSVVRLPDARDARAARGGATRARKGEK